MSLLLKSGDQYFEISDADLKQCEISADEFDTAAHTDTADRALVSAVLGDGFVERNQTQIGKGCDGNYGFTCGGYGASCSKGTKCP